jgi:hypothetical protein
VSIAAAAAAAAAAEIAVAAREMQRPVGPSGRSSRSGQAGAAARSSRSELELRDVDRICRGPRKCDAQGFSQVDGAGIQDGAEAEALGLRDPLLGR